MDTNMGNNIRITYWAVKKTDLKWYKRLWNIITGHKDRNYHWVEIKSTEGWTQKMIDYSSPDEVIKHLSHVKNTIGIDYNNPFGAFKTDYRIELYYLGNMFYCLDTSVFDKKIDDFLKESDEE